MSDLREAWQKTGMPYLIALTVTMILRAIFRPVYGLYPERFFRERAFEIRMMIVFQIIYKALGG